MRLLLIAVLTCASLAAGARALTARGIDLGFPPIELTVSE